MTDSLLALETGHSDNVLCLIECLKTLGHSLVKENTSFGHNYNYLLKGGIMVLWRHCNNNIS
jgi:hypothetical protein